jgi:hypothetical protein
MNEIEMQKQKLDHLIELFSKKAHEKLDKAINSGGVPGEWLGNDGCYLLQKAVLDSLCRERPFSVRNEHDKMDFDNLHLMI